MLRPSSDRAFPSSVEELVTWLWGQISHVNNVYRRASMHVFVELAALQDFESTDSNYSIAVDTIGGNEAVVVASQVERYLLSTGLPGLSSLQVYTPGSKAWLESWNAALDSSTWLLKSHYATPAQLFYPSRSETVDTSRKRRAGMDAPKESSDAKILLDNIPIFVDECFNLRGDDESDLLCDLRAQVRISE